MIKGVPRTRDPEIKSCLLYRLNQSGAPENIFYLKQNKPRTTQSYAERASSPAIPFPRPFLEVTLLTMSFPNLPQCAATL